jgi:hypothetical protein
MAAVPEGASLEVRYVEPSLDLATLAACLADAVPPPPHAPPQSARSPARDRARSLIEWQPEAGTLVVDTGAALSRLAGTRDYRTLQPGPDGGFIRDAPVPRAKTRAYVGGRIVEGSGGRLQQSLEQMVSRIDAELDRAAEAGCDPVALVHPAAGALRAIGQRLHLDADAFLNVETRVRRTSLGPVATTKRERETDVGRLMAAIEEVDGDRADHFERMASAVRELLRQAGLADRAIDTAIEHHRYQAQRPGTQLSRFFDFLEDAALVRVRLEATFLIMEAIAHAAIQRRPSEDIGLLVAYIARATGLFRALAAPDGEELRLDLSREFGAEADLALHDEVVTAGFAGCLPVWPEWVTQLFERRQGAQLGAVTAREVSYRFRVNGRTPEDGRPAFESRLGRIRRTLRETTGPVRGARRSLAELVFLSAVVPLDSAAEASAKSALAAAREVARELEHGDSSAVARTLASLEVRAAAVARISRALVGVLKDAGTIVSAGILERSWDFFVNVRRSLVDVRRIGFAVDSPLMLPANSPGAETAAFFRQVHVTAGRPLPGHLFSLRVRVRLADGALRASPEIAHASIARELPRSWVQVVMRPDEPGSTSNGASSGGAASSLADARCAAPWLVSPRVEVRHDLRWLGDPRSLDERARHLLAAHRCGFSILVYTVLYCLLRRVRRALSPPEMSAGVPAPLAAGIFRIQRAGRGGDPMGGEQGLFAAAHALELALSRDFDVQMQGLVLGAAEDTRDKRRGQFGAFFARVPAVIERRSDVDLEPCVSLIVYGGRPCNGHPEQAGLRESTLCITRIYLARAVASPLRGYRLSRDAVRYEVRDDGGEAELPAVVLEEIHRLYEREGCRHVMILCRRYGSRRIGWAASRLRVPELPRLLADAASRYPGLCLYPLVRDTFPVTRMRERSAGEDAFEILRPDEHVEAYPAEARELRHAYTPVYSLATLHVVGPASKPQSGFCTYFLLRDSGAGSIEAAEQIRANLLLPASSVRADLIAVLRGVHYLESERPVTDEQTLQPVLDPYAWLQPDAIGQVGEVLVNSSRRRAGAVVLSLSAVLARISRVLHAPPAGTQRTQR